MVSSPSSSWVPPRTRCSVGARCCGYEITQQRCKLYFSKYKDYMPQLDHTMGVFIGVNSRIITNSTVASRHFYNYLNSHVTVASRAFLGTFVLHFFIKLLSLLPFCLRRSQLLHALIEAKHPSFDHDSAFSLLTLNDTTL